MITFSMENMCNTVLTGLQSTRPIGGLKICFMKSLHRCEMVVAMEILLENEMKSDFTFEELKIPQHTRTNTIFFM